MLLDTTNWRKMKKQSDNEIISFIALLPRIRWPPHKARNGDPAGKEAGNLLVVTDCVLVII